MILNELQIEGKRECSFFWRPSTSRWSVVISSTVLIVLYRVLTAMIFFFPINSWSTFSSWNCITGPLFDLFS